VERPELGDERVQLLLLFIQVLMLRLDILTYIVFTLNFRYTKSTAVESWVEEKECQSSTNERVINCDEKHHDEDNPLIASCISHSSRQRRIAIGCFYMIHSKILILF
jgi:hypothetical protein